MRTTVELDFLQANQIVAALDTRAEYLAHHAAPDDEVTARCVADCLSAGYAIRDAFRLTEQPIFSACCGAGGGAGHWVGCRDRAPLVETEARMIWGDR